MDAAVAAVVAVAVDAADAAEKEREMNDQRRSPILRRIALAAALAATLAVALAGATTAAAATTKQKTFATPDEAVTALIDAAKADDSKAMLAILGPDAKPIVTSGDPVADEAARTRFVTSYDEKHELVAGPDDTMQLQTGNDAWPMPIPLVKDGDRWRFDTPAGKDELLTRRIGANELATIQSVLAYVDAQREYHDLNPQGTKLPQYAQLISSSKGKKDGLYWDAKEGEPESPLGPVFASARGEGYKPGQGKPIPYHGYYYRILKAQGPNAPGGSYDYVAHGQMIGGFALVAYPAQWGSSGVMTFLVNQQGTVYQKDLGPDTTKVAQAMKTFDPDSSWTKVNPADEDDGANDPKPAAAPS